VYSRRVPSVRLAALVLVAFAAHAAGARAEDDVVTVGTFVRGDSDTTVVISPTVRGRVELFDEETHVDAEYTADIWTSASIDVRTAATVAVSEQRDEINAGLERRIDDFSVRGVYRYSSENDYEAHGGIVAGTLDLEGHCTIFELRLNAEQDTVGRSGDATFARPLTRLGGRLGYTQVLDPQMVLQVAYELGYAEGYLASPYRFVGLGGDGRCGGSAELCVPETHPGERLRHAVVLRARRALDDHVSLHLDYRFYVDDWGLLANTAAAQLGWMHDEDGLFALRYRLHQQTGAAFYRSTYPAPSGTLLFVTRDRELSPLWTHRLALSYERNVEIGETGPTVRLAAALGGTYLLYEDFVGLGEVFALDGTLSVGVEL